MKHQTSTSAHKFYKDWVYTGPHPPFNSGKKFQKISKLNNKNYRKIEIAVVLRGLVGNFEVWAPKFSAYKKTI